MPIKFMLGLLGLIASTASFAADIGEDDDAESDQSEVSKKPSETTGHSDEKLGSEGIEALRAERSARRLAESKIKDLEKSISDLTKQIQSREDEDAEKLGEWQKLAETRGKKIEELENKILEDALEAEKAKILTKYKLSGDEAENVHGETAEEYEKSAKLQAKLLGKASGPDTSGGEGDSKPSDKRSKDSKLSNWKFK